MTLPVHDTLNVGLLY